MAVPKMHEVRLKTEAFEKFTYSDYQIMKGEGISTGDYILFVAEDEEGNETGLFRMTTVREIVESEGLKDGYVLITVNKL